MRNHGMIIKRETLIERVWGFDFVGDTNRVDVYVRRVRRKIEADPAHPRYLHTVRGTGYVFRAEGELADGQISTPEADGTPLAGLSIG